MTNGLQAGQETEPSRLPRSTNLQTRLASVTAAVLLGACGSGAAWAQTPLTTLADAPIETAEPRLGRLDVGALPTLVLAQTAQAPAQVTVTATSSDDDMKFSVYPILLWAPVASVTTVVPAFPNFPGGPDLPGGSGTSTASFDGAALAGMSIEKGFWRVDADGIWASLLTTRDLPLLEVDLDLIYGHVSGGVKVYKDLYVTGGVRRVALKYDIRIADRPVHFERKPGIWDPLVGAGWHSALGSRWIMHVIGEGGGFGVGADVDLVGSVRTDFKIATHVGLTFGYTVLYLKLSHTVLQRTLEVKQTLHGPVVGLGIYF